MVSRVLLSQSVNALNFFRRRRWVIRLDRKHSYSVLASLKHGLQEMSEEAIITVDHSFSWTAPQRDRLRSAYFKIHQMKCNLNFRTGLYVLGDYHLYLYSDRIPAEPFDILLHVFVGKEEVSHSRTTVKDKCVTIWRGIRSDLVKLVPDIDQREFLFRTVLLGNTTHKKEIADVNPPLMSLAASMPSYHSEALSRDFTKLLDAGSSSDIEISCSGRVFKAHRIVLSARSEVLQSKMAEGESGRVDIGDVDGDVFGQFLSYLYSGALPDLSPDSAKALYEVADKYAVLQLRRACASFVCRNLTRDNVCDILVMSDRHSDLEFKEAVVHFMIREKIPRTDENWSDFCGRHPKLAFEVLNRCCDRFFEV